MRLPAPQARVTTAVLAALVTVGAARPGTAPAAATLPPRLNGYLQTHVHLDEASRAKLLAGEPVVKLLPSDESKEIAVFGAVWIGAPVESYLASVKDIERFESGDAFRVTKKISSPPRLDDFAQLELPQDDVDDLRKCKVSDCALKLSEPTIERVRNAIDWSRPDAREQANRLMRQIALEYVTSYLEGGNQRLAVFRDSTRPTFVAKEFATIVDQLAPLAAYLPEIRRYLLDYPKATLPKSESFLYWQEAEFGLKPTIRVNHVVMAEERDGAVVASKMLYASHYFWTALDLRVLVRDPQRGEGFWLVTETRSRSDGLGGFAGRIVRGKAREEVEQGTEAVLRVTKSAFEGK
jgi:hypothetical protein